MERYRRSYLNADELYGCPHRFLLDKVADHSLVLDKPALPIGIQHRRAMSAARTDNIYLQLAEQPGTVLIGDGPDAVGATLQAIREQAPIICNATLPADDIAERASASCILMRSPDAADPYTYTPVITVNHKVYDIRPQKAPRPPRIPLENLARPSLIPHSSPLNRWDPTPNPDLKLRHHTRDQLRLTHLWLLMENVGIPNTGQGGVIDLRGELAVVHWINESLPNYLDNYRARKALLDQVVQDVAPYALDRLPTRSCRRAECHVCGWWESRCRDELQARQDVSLVVSASQADALARENIYTIAQLAAPDVMEPDDWPGKSFHTAVALARAHQQGYTLVRKGPDHELPPVDVEIDIDMESVLDNGAYLWGTLLSYRTEDIAQRIGVTPGYTPFVTWKKLPDRSTAAVFVQMWKWLTGVWRRVDEEGLTFRVYCYAQQGERQWIRSNVKRFPDQLGMPSAREVRALLNSEHWVDMFRVVEKTLLGVRGLGLKKVAPVAGFQWRDEDPSGESSIAWHALATEPTYPNEEVQQRILAYNEDDVRATKAIREWLRSGVWKQQLPLREDLLHDTVLSE